MRLSWNEIRARAARFADEWRDAAYEKGETQSFYNEFFEIFGVQRRSVARYEEHVKKLDNRSGFIDLFWPGVLIVEQKSEGRDLEVAYGQAGEYFDSLPERDRPRYILVSDFQSFELHDLDEGEQTSFALVDLPSHVEAFGFILGVQRRIFRDQDPVNVEASASMGRLHDALEASGYSGHDLEVFLVRTVFCLFADDTGIFEPRDLFLDLLETRTRENGSDLGPALARLFQVLNTPVDQRQAKLDEDLARFPYVNGDLFAARLTIPDFDAAMRSTLIDACRLRLGGHLARHLRCALPVCDGRRRAARPRCPLHHREKHPEGDRAAVSRRSESGVQPAPGAQGQAPPRRTDSLSEAAWRESSIQPVASATDQTKPSVGWPRPTTSRGSLIRLTSTTRASWARARRCRIDSPSWSPYSTPSTSEPTALRVTTCSATPTST